MTWIHRAQPEAHTCQPPMSGWQFAAGRLGDLWRCDCRRLWRVAKACDICEHYGSHNYGQCRIGTTWRPATLWQRIRNRRNP